MRSVRLGLVTASLLALVAGETAAQGPIRIGFLSPLSGAIAAAGKDMYSGCELYWQEAMRSEEHTSELQSPDHLVCRLLLEKKKTTQAYALPHHRVPRHSQLSVPPPASL